MAGYPIRRRCVGCGEQIEWVPHWVISLWLSVESGSGYCAAVGQLHEPAARRSVEIELRLERCIGQR